ncbi:MAG: ATP-dependent zinc metalloprotease FtsH [Clostridia bacterium]|nr:ATP-dependent zinc metalloprotease FtsH [Clostridia bacterium]
MTWGILILICVLATSLISGLSNPEKVTYSDIVNYFKQEQVTEFKIVGNELTYKLKPEGDLPAEEKTFVLYSTARFLDQVDPYITSAQEKGILPSYDIQQASSLPLWVTYIPYVLLIGAVLFFGWIMLKQMSGGGKGGAMSFGRAKLRLADTEKSKITFSDVAGADEEKEELQEIVEFLKNPKKYTSLGARIPRGVLMVGPPGTGKTYMAKATAGEAGVPFFSISGSDFVELYVGVGASRVRDTFEQAKKNAPCIVFIDEIDAVGRQRGAGLGGGNDEREQTLNQLLVEMDGFEQNEGVIVMAATNRPDVLDSALLRPGRFDRQIVIHLPDVKAREEILRIHARKKPMDKKVNFEDVAKATSGFAPAELENVLNEAALLAARGNRKVITMNEITDAIMKVELGVEKKSRLITDKEKELTAYHEAGHAIVTVVADGNSKVNEISIIPRGMAGGYTSYLPVENKSYMSKGEMLDRIIHCMGGRAAEELCLNDISTGAAGDIQQATEMARQMVMRYGMSEKLGPILFGTGREEVFLGRDFTAESKTYSEKVAATIDEEIKRIIDEQYERAKKILQEHLDQLHVIAKQLILHEKITGEQFRALLEGTDPAEVFPESETQKPEEKQDETPAEQAEERSEAAAEPVAEEKPEAEEPAAPEGTKTNEE